MIPPSPDAPAAPYQIPADVLINGGQNITVKDIAGNPVEVKVILVPLKKMGDYYEKLGDINAFVEFVTAKPAGFAETLDDDSIFLIDETATQLNSFRAARFLERQKKIRDTVTGANNRLGIV